MIQTRNLCKRFAGKTAVDSVSFTVEPGEVLGFLGPNGAGKSTTMKMIAGFLTPTAGTASVCGHDVLVDPLAVRRSLGYLPEGAPAYGEMPVAGFLDFVADVRDLAGEHRRKRLAAVVDRLSLGPVLAQPIDTLSKGFKRRVGLAVAILHDPPALVLDEPTDGLDPNQKHEVRQLIVEMSRQRTIVISTHILEEVSAVCTRAIIIADGKVLIDASPEQLEQRSRYHGAVSLKPGDSIAVRAALESVPGVSAVEVEPQSGRLYVFSAAGRSLADPVAERLRARELEFSALQIERGRMDEVFRTITSRAGEAQP